MPTRNVTGFVGAQRNSFGNYYSVRQQNAHAWVEYWNPIGQSAGRWELLDATPAATAAPPTSRGRRLQELYEALAARWDRHVAAFDLADQANLAQRVANPFDRLQRRWSKAARGNAPTLAALAATPLLAFAGWRWLRRQRLRANEEDRTGATPKRHAATELARGIERALAGHGSRGTHETLREYVARVCPPPAAEAAAQLVALYEATRWGDETLDAPEMKKALRNLDEALAGLA